MTTTTRPPNIFRRLGRGAWILMISVLAVAVAGSWLLVVYLTPGTAVLNEVKAGIQSDRAGSVQTVNSVLTRATTLSEHVELMVLYATPEYFSVAARQAKALTYDPEATYVFIVNEDTHMDDLPMAPTPVQLRVNDGELIEPMRLEMVTYSDHHKVSIATFSKTDATGTPILNEQDGGVLKLVATPTMIHAGDMAMANGTMMGESEEIAMSWQVPIEYPEQAFTAQHLPIGSMVAIAIGLLATVLTPCLIQLLVFYLSTLVGASTAKVRETLQIEPHVRRKLIHVAIGFVAGYTLIFTAAGALAGFAGETLQASWSAWVRPMAIGSGVLIILLGIWMAYRSRAPLVCKLPLQRVEAAETRSGVGGFFVSIMTGLAFAVGCSTCFGGALIATMLIYVGTLGSTWEGALILFFFSMGVGIPFILAAGLLTRVLPLVQKMQRALPVIGMASSVIMIFFGVLLITDNFHQVSNAIYPLLGLR